jgi:hypothetical protein
LTPTPLARRRPGHLHAGAALTLAGRIAHHWKPRRPRQGGLLAFLGPGLITGASDDDPSGIATYSQVGAQFGYGMCWVMLFTWPLMAAIQEVSARIGRVTGEGIAGNIREHYSRSMLLIIVALLLIANIINLGADLGAMGAALQLLLRGSAHLYVVVFAVICDATHGRGDLAQIARGFGLRGTKVTSLGQFEGLFREHQAQDGASLWDVHVDDLIPSRNFRRVHYGEA